MEGNIEQLCRDFELAGMRLSLHKPVIEENITSQVSRFLCYEVYYPPEYLNFLSMGMEIWVKYDNDAQRHRIDKVNASLIERFSLGKVVEGLDMEKVEHLLRARPYPDMITPTSQQQCQVEREAYRQHVEEIMKVLHDRSPQTFALMMVKYRPEVKFTLNPLVAGEIETLVKSRCHSAVFEYQLPLSPQIIFRTLADVAKKSKKGKQQGRHQTNKRGKPGANRSN